MAKKQSDLIQQPLFQLESDWTPPVVSELPSWTNAKRIAIDCETKDLQLTKLGPGVRRGGEIIGVSFAIEDGPSFYLPVGHSEGNLDKKKVFQYLKDQAQEFDGVVVGANLQYDLDYLWSAGILFPKVKWYRDVQVAEPLLDELQFRYSLDHIAARWGIPGKDETLLKQAGDVYNLKKLKEEMYKLPAKYVGPYGEEDVKLPLRLLRRQEREIDAQGLWDIYNLESKLLPVLVKMTQRGVAIDFDKLQQIEEWAVAEANKALNMVKSFSGITLSWEEVWKASAIAPILDKLNIPYDLTPKTKKPKINKSLFDKSDSPVVESLSRARRMNKIVTTFAGSIRRHAINGRIHCGFNQLRIARESGDEKGPAYGRISSTNPNMQQQPARDPELGPLWRSIYIPDTELQWLCADFSQQEPRMLIHFAELCGLPRAEEAANRYRSDPKTDNHSMMAEMCGIPRKEAKAIFLGKCYGMGGAKLCHEIGLPTEWVISNRTGGLIEIAGSEGQGIINRFDAQLPFVKMLGYMCEQRAKQRGYITTLLGRRCRFPKVDGIYEWCHKALNRLIQGSSADQMKKAMVELDAAGYPIQLQVHDEVDTSIDSIERAKEMAEIMVNCIDIGVPSKVDIEIGPNWGEAK